MKITRDVVTDLWPLYVEGAASADTRALVEGALRENPGWRAALEAAGAGAGAALPVVKVEPDGEARTLNKIKWRYRVMRWMLLLAMVFTMQAFGRIVMDTSWDVSPRNFIATACVAGVFWVGFVVAALRCRRMGP